MSKVIKVAAFFTIAFASGAHAHSRGTPLTPDTFQEVLGECDAGNGNSCQKLGDMYRIEKRARAVGQEVNLDLSMEFYERGCAFGDSGACGSVNYLYGHPRYHGYDPARALPYFKKRCEKRGADSSDCGVVERLQRDL